ncbi:Potassium-transporting ATPase C chain [Marinomonas spartinae]|uniref:Potassium-transporting ATPase KdpC subunit n=1 Tax=Marinomonas spartinae TaxID=1792290 RepID=A0A1A8TL77_9GAMM|nr:potassium-transporting ATPase subunit KdpC [Marinomonas spartinae]SBS34627.1 Potassium-transporting ATPase C chain [Marinomonas spartinae]
MNAKVTDDLHEGVIQWHQGGLSKQIALAVRMSLVMLVLCGIIYTGSVTMVAQTLFPFQSTGSVIDHNGKPVGSKLIGQLFQSADYFHGRPSAVGYDPKSTGGSNLAPSNLKLRAEVEQRSLAIQTSDHVTASQIPVDLLAASGSGVDPDISPAAALLQVDRVAAQRHLSVNAVKKLVDQHIEHPQWAIFGQARVNVLMLNLALETLSDINNTQSK